VLDGGSSALELVNGFSRQFTVPERRNGGQPYCEDSRAQAFLRSGRLHSVHGRKRKYPSHARVYATHQAYRTNQSSKNPK
jgi:hypothetical protein